MNNGTSKSRKWSWPKLPAWRPVWRPISKQKPQKMNPQQIDERLAQLLEIEEAKNEWKIAQKKLDYVTEKDQIDYAIYALEAAEKRYEMLLRNAKKNKLTSLDPGTGKWPEVKQHDQAQ